MSWLEQYRAMARYNQWMNHKLYTSCAQLSDEERKRDRGAFFKSIHGTLNHLLLGDSVWLMRFLGDPSVMPRDSSGAPIRLTSMAQELCSDFAELRRERERLDALTLTFSEQLTEARLSETISYGTSAGAKQSHPLWWAVGHFFNHQTHHRGQVTTLLSQAGLDVGATDLVAMLRAEADSSRG